MPVFEDQVQGFLVGVIACCILQPSHVLVCSLLAYIFYDNRPVPEAVAKVIRVERPRDLLIFLLNKAWSACLKPTAAAVASMDNSSSMNGSQK